MKNLVWRYKNLVVDNFDEIEKVLHSWGKWGWECYQIIQSEEGWRLFLKRRHTSGEAEIVND